jgi:hypothetical protein
MITDARNPSELRRGVRQPNAAKYKPGKCTSRALRANGLLSAILFAGSVFIPAIAAGQVLQTQTKPKSAVPDRVRGNQ